MIGLYYKNRDLYPRKCNKPKFSERAGRTWKKFQIEIDGKARDVWKTEPRGPRIYLKYGVNWYYFKAIEHCDNTSFSFKYKEPDFRKFIEKIKL